MRPRARATAGTRAGSGPRASSGRKQVLALEPPLDFTGIIRPAGCEHSFPVSPRSAPYRIGRRNQMPRRFIALFVLTAALLAQGAAAQMAVSYQIVCD